MTKYQLEVIRIIKEHSEKAFIKLPEIVKELSLTYKDITAVAYVETSLGYSPSLCRGNEGGIFQLFESASIEALDYALRKHPKLVGSLYLVEEFKKHPACDENHVKLEYWENTMHYYIEELLCYFGSLLLKQKNYLPEIDDLDKFERLILLYHTGPCIKVIEGKNKGEWNKSVKDCLKERIGEDVPINVISYLSAIRRGRKIEEEFFRG